jgi:hypothetical protein
MSHYAIVQVEKADGKIIDTYEGYLRAFDANEAYRTAAAILAEDFGPMLWGFTNDDQTLAFGEDYGNRTRVYEYECLEVE